MLFLLPAFLMPLIACYMIYIHIEDELKELLPELTLGCIESRVQVRPSDADLVEKMVHAAETLAQSVSIEAISARPAIHASREAYKALGKAPSRYRLSAEALSRRVAQGKGLYHINNAVDLLNLVSLQSGYSIGGYDADRFQRPLSLRRGHEGEPYEAIGRGEFNIHNLPVLSDMIGAFGSPTSDSARTSVTEDTTHYFMVIFHFGGEDRLREVMADAEVLLSAHAAATEIESYQVR
jgi:DNA/RNA-binding domain of Phe-tRNA-synthetase-like protein